MIFSNFYLLLLLITLINSHVIHVPDITEEFSKEDDGIQVTTGNKSIWKIETGQDSFILFDKLPPCQFPVTGKNLQPYTLY